MRHVHWYPLLMLMLIPRPSPALDLRWSSGATNLTFTPATRCTLVFQADSTEARLPAEWRLLWAADSSSIQFVAMDSLEACLLDEAQVSRIDAPATAADSAANLLTAHFCSDESNATVARQVVDLPAGGRGKLKVVALDPNDPDSSQVIESNEVTYNGGVEGGYPPVVLHASSVHQSLQLRVTAVGSDLSTASSLSIAALDSSWSLPLTITAQNDHAVTAVAPVAALLPACQASVGSESGAVSAAPLHADEEPASLSPTSCQASFVEDLLPPPPPPYGYAILPKDFAFVRGFVDTSSNRYALHLFYIRRSLYPGAETEKNIGHTWTTDFDSWSKPDTVALTVRPGRFDNFHVWAPTIAQRGPTFYMLYTGVDRTSGGQEHQRIGIAASTDLNTWIPADTVVLTAPSINWASKNPLDYNHSQQLRDPFVMEDPSQAGHWLMYFVAVDSLRAPKMAVGVARSTDLTHWTADHDPLRSTENPTFQGPTNVVESPHVFRRNGQWWLPYTVNNGQVFFETISDTISSAPTDTTVAHWTQPVSLRDVAEGGHDLLKYWHATEYLQINQLEYLAAYNDNASSIDIMGVFVPSRPESALVDSVRLSCPQIAGVADRDHPVDALRMVVSRIQWSAPEVGLRLELPSRMPVKLAIYDIAGRRRFTLLDRELPGGVTDVTWDGRDETGTRVTSGMYFVRMSCARGARVSKVVMLR